MIAKGFDLSDAEIARRYKNIAGLLTMPWYFYSRMSEMIAPPARGKVLDIGCGNGFMLKALKKIRPDAEYFGLDNALELVRGTKKRLGGQRHFVHASANRPLPFKDRSFDLIVCTEVIEHLKQPKSLLREIRRLLKPGGKAAITVPNGSAFMPFMPLAARLPQRFAPITAFVHGEHPVKTPQPIAAVYFFDEIAVMFEEENLRVARIGGFESFPYLFDILRWFLNRCLLREIGDMTWKLQFWMDKTVGLRCPRLFYRLAFILEPGAKGDE